MSKWKFPLSISHGPFLADNGNDCERDIAELLYRIGWNVQQRSPSMAGVSPPGNVRGLPPPLEIYAWRQKQWNGPSHLEPTPHPDIPEEMGLAAARALQQYLTFVGVVSEGSGCNQKPPNTAGAGSPCKSLIAPPKGSTVPANGVVVVVGPKLPSDMYMASFFRLREELNEERQREQSDADRYRELFREIGVF